MITRKGTIALVHLSDIHLKKSENSIFDRVNGLICAIQNEILDCDEIFFVVSGDIAYSGDAKEYNNAFDLFEKIRADIDKYTKKTSHFVFTAGNHDCDYNKPKKELRDNLIATLQENGIKAFYKDMVDECCATQEEYFTFESIYEEQNTIMFSDKLYKQYKFSFEYGSVVFNCYNSSWVSERHEVAGKMSYPNHLYKDEPTKHKADLNISVVHHPLNWLEPMNRQSFRKQLESTSDLILTGHEHSGGTSVKHDFDGGYVTYLEAGVLQDSNNSINSEFLMIKFNLDDLSQKLFKYVWVEDKYTQTVNDSKWIAYQRSENMLIKKQHINSEFSKFIRDAGTAFYHPRMPEISLDDIYIYPDFKEVSTLEKFNAKKNKNSIKYHEIFQKSLNDEKIIIYGDERSGKTSLAKKLFTHYYNLNYVPVFIEGEKLNSLNPDEIVKIVSKHYVLQYSETTLEDFTQLSKNEKILIIDDFHSNKYNLKFRQKLITSLTIHYPNMIIIVNSAYRLEEIIPSVDGEFDLLKDYKKFEIKTFGHVLRTELINLWNSMGQVDTIDPNELHQLNDRTKKIIDTVIGYNFVPSYPLFILTLLQANEAGTSHNLKDSPYGHYYDVLIKTALSKINLKNEEIEAYYGYLTELAYVFFTSKLQYISKEGLDNFHVKYSKEYYINQDYWLLVSKLEDVSILSCSNKEYRFRYKYVYYYFVANYLAINITVQEIKERIAYMCKKLHIEEFANIIMFLTHMSKDPFIIDQITGTAKGLFSGVSVANLEGDVSVINTLIKEVPQMVLKNKAINDARVDKLKEQDEIEKIENDHDVVEYNDTEEEGTELDLSGLINLSFKTIEIIGQILKNNYGTIKGEIKVALCQEAYDIGLRSISSLFDLLNDNTEGVVHDIEQMFLESNKAMDETSVNKISREFIFNCCYMFSYAYIKRIANSVGTEKLAMVFKLIKDSNDTVAINLIDMAIKLEHLNTLSSSEIELLQKRVEHNHIALGLLKKFVIDYLYMYDVEYTVRQRLCNILGIPIQKQLAKEIKYEQNQK